MPWQRIDFKADDTDWVKIAGAGEIIQTLYSSAPTRFHLLLDVDGIDPVNNPTPLKDLPIVPYQQETIYMGWSLPYDLYARRMGSYEKGTIPIVPGLNEVYQLTVIT